MIFLLSACAPTPVADTGPAATTPWDPWDTVGSTDTGPAPVDPGPSEIALQGELIGAPDLPLDPWVASIAALSPIPPPSAVLQLYISRATTEDSLQGGLLGGLAPTMTTVLGGSGSLVPGPIEGSYVLPDRYEADYVWGGGGTVEIATGKIDGWNGSASLYQPASLAAGIPESMPQGAPLAVDYPGEGFTSSVAVVLDATGAVTWTNDPSNVTDLFAQNQASTTSLVIPPAAFPSAGDYVVGLAACTPTHSANLTELEPELTAVRACRMEYSKLTIQ
jgi:hypothetical protein